MAGVTAEPGGDRLHRREEQDGVALGATVRRGVARDGWIWHCPTQAEEGLNRSREWTRAKLRIV